MRFNVNLGINLPAWRSWLFRHAADSIREQELNTGVDARAPRTPSRSIAHEYLWHYSSPMEEMGTRWVPHLIVGKDAGTIQVEASPSLVPGGQPRTRRSGGTYSIDRRELRRLGFARAESSQTVFFREPQPSDRLVTAVNALKQLGLWFPIDEADLSRAYRQKARSAHPDAGGSSQRFVQLQEDYRRAQELLDLSWR